MAMWVCVCVWILPTLTCFIKICNFFMQRLDITVYSTPGSSHPLLFIEVFIMNLLSARLVMSLEQCWNYWSCEILKKPGFFLLFNSEKNTSEPAQEHKRSQQWGCCVSQCWQWQRLPGSLSHNRAGCCWRTKPEASAKTEAAAGGWTFSVWQSLAGQDPALTAGESLLAEGKSAMCHYFSA